MEPVVSIEIDSTGSHSHSRSKTGHLKIVCSTLQMYAWIFRQLLT